MRLSASALRNFLVCATATAVVSSASTFVVESESRTQLEGNTGEEKSQQQHDHHMNNHGQHYHNHNESMGRHTNNLHTTRDGLLRNASNSTQLHSERRRIPCHPDLGVLACPKPNQQCQKSAFLDSVTSTDEDGNTLHLDIEEWHCVDEAMMHRQLQFPPSGEFYDLCTYEKKLIYNYNSTIRYPSAWDLCVCKYYDYQLPDGQSFIYTDVDYCHKINKYYCATYYNAAAEMEPSAYDACLCSVYDGKAIPNKDSDFCFELPMRYCDAYYVGNVTGIAQCLCDNFGYDDWCDFDPPDGFAFPSPSPPSNEPTIAPTFSPSDDPTQQPSYSPTEKPTTPNPTNKPTRRRRKQGTNKKKNRTPGPTSKPKPTPFPTMGRVINLFPQTSKPTAKPSPRPTPTPDPTLKPTGLKPAPSGFLTVIDFPKADNNDLNNINNLSKVRTSIRRQPNIANRPGGALRLPVVSFFREEPKQEEEEEEAAAAAEHGIGP